MAVIRSSLTKRLLITPRCKRHSLVFTVLWLVFASCAVPLGIEPIAPDQYPHFRDDLSSDSLLEAIDRQLHYLGTQVPETQTRIGSETFTYSTLQQSMEAFREIIKRGLSPFELDQLIQERFTVYEAAGRDSQKQILLTGYYEPLFAGSYQKRPPYMYPLYAIPDSLVIEQGKTPGIAKIGRLTEQGKLRPYWSREEIERNNLLQGKELVYLRDPLDAFLLHVQGSGRIKFPDGKIRSIHFAASNGLEYNSLGKLFVDKGIMTKDEVSIPKMRNYFSEHPEEIRSMLNHNPRYIFFKWGDENGPKGSLGERLTPGRSIAIDQSILPVGAVAYLVSRKPVLNKEGDIDYWVPLNRFVVPQDSGAAIQGAGRVDLFWGNGAYAETAANHMKETGKLYFLLQKNFELPEKIR